jgi:magnesium-transporting ATPase (P-type)
MMGRLLPIWCVKTPEICNVSSIIAGSLGCLSLYIVIHQGSAVDQDHKTMSHLASTLLLGTTIVAVVNIVVTVILSIAYGTQKRNGRRDGFNLAQVRFEAANRSKISLWLPMALVSLVVMQFLVGLLLWHSARFPSWSIILIIMESLILLVGSAMILWNVSRAFQSEQNGEIEQGRQSEKVIEVGRQTQSFPTRNLYTILE